MAVWAAVVSLAYAPRMRTGITSWRCEDREVILLAVLASACFSLQTSISSAQVPAATPEALSAPVHPIYGKALKTVATDERLTNLSAQSDGTTMKEVLSGLISAPKQSALPRIP